MGMDRGKALGIGMATKNGKRSTKVVGGLGTLYFLQFTQPQPRSGEDPSARL